MELVAVITLCEWPVLGTWGWYRQTGVTKQCLHALLNTFQVWYVSVYHISTHLGVHAVVDLCWLLGLVKCVLTLCAF